MAGMYVPSDAPEDCPVCDVGYHSVSRHGVEEHGLLVNLAENERFARVCVDAVEGGMDFYHHDHGQV
jgi:hypothetical protein